MLLLPSPMFPSIGVVPLPRVPQSFVRTQRVRLLRWWRDRKAANLEQQAQPPALKPKARLKEALAKLDFATLSAKNLSVHEIGAIMRGVFELAVPPPRAGRAATALAYSNAMQLSARVDQLRQALEREVPSARHLTAAAAEIRRRKREAASNAD